MRNRNYLIVGTVCAMLFLSACKNLNILSKQENKSVPASYSNSQDTVNSGKQKWKEFFSDPYLGALIDSSLNNNQELNIILQEINISNNEIMARKGAYLPFLNVGGGAGVDKVGRYTSQGASEATTEIKPGRAMPDPVPDIRLGAYANWEVDIWRKLRNSKKSAVSRYLASVEGKNFMVTHLISEIANSYYELLALDNQLAILTQNIEIQNNAFEIVKLQKEATRVTELAVRRFEAQVYHTRSMQYAIQQSIVVAENRINFLVGRFPQPVQRSNADFNTLIPKVLQMGIPSQLFENRPDIRQAENELAATKLDVKVARANFYPSLNLSAGIGLQAFNPAFLVKAPESLLFSMLGDIVGPVINRNEIKAVYFNVNAKQTQAVYNYQRTILTAFIEVSNQLSNISNLEKSYDLKSKQVDALMQSVQISNDLFKFARADYMEVLLTQRDALESRFELVDTKKQQMNAMVDMYRALGGGWK
jgi:NodT family efflux transporter outer membrane factor (OMF) lipoprotein